MPCPKGPGRPKVGRQGGVSLKRKKDADAAICIEQPTKKRRGRPPGSKNKPKENDVAREDLRKRAEYSAGSENTLPYFDSGDICSICEFAMNDPIKKLKKITKCMCMNHV